MKCLLLSFGLLLLAFSVSSKMQNVTVKGVAVCNKRRYANAHVKLFDEDTFNFNDLLAEGYSNSEGEFELFGQEDEVFQIQPFIRIEHGCRTSKPGCRRIGDYAVPQDSIGGVFDMTYVTLDIKVFKDKEKC